MMEEKYIEGFGGKDRRKEPLERPKRVGARIIFKCILEK
jgi:hypothetical protein